MCSTKSITFVVSLNLNINLPRNTHHFTDEKTKAQATCPCSPGVMELR